MKKKTITAAGVAAGALLAVAVPLAASAHVTVDPGDAAAGSTSTLTFAFGHGCDGSATTALVVTVPDGVYTAKPVVDAGWDISTTLEDVDDGVTDAHGDPVTQRVSTVTYTAATPVPDGYVASVGLQVALPDDEGETLAFPVEQRCESGSVSWSEVAADGEDEPENPAPTVTLTAAEASADGHDAATADTATAAASDDVVARSLGIAGLVVGAVGIVVAVLARRSAGGRRPADAAGTDEG